jgi:hypothetical protein
MPTVKRNVRRAIAWSAIVLMAASLSACSPDRQTKQAAKSESSEPKALKFQDEAGQLVIKNQDSRLPKGFPDDVPVYGGAAIKSTVVGDGPSESPMIMVILETPAEAEKVAVFYEKRLAAGGWEIDTGSTAAQEGIVYAAAKEGKAVSISIARPKKGRTTVISISVTSR